MATAARALAHAKVNLDLRVLAREAGGHHGLETVFHRLELSDVVRVRVDAAGRSLDLAGPELPPAGLGPTERNLAWRAADAYVAATGWPSGFAIEVEKHIPVGGGMGGGSADAGAVLRVLDALAPRPLGEASLLELAAPIGADVPFLTGEAVHALAWSRGERMLALPPLPARDVLLLLPSFGVPTAEAYARLAASRVTWAPRGGVRRVEELLDWSTVAAGAGNDFAPVVEEWHPELRTCVEWLRRRGASPAMLSGSGSVVFGVVGEGGADGDGRDDAPPAGCRLLRTRTLARVVAVERIG